MNWLTFDAEAGDGVFIVLQEGVGMEFMVMELFGPDAVLVLSADSRGAATTATIDEQLETAGTYTIRVRQRRLGQGSGVKTGSYTLSFNQVSP